MSKFIWRNGKRFPRNAGEEETTQRVILELDVELFRELEAYCTDRGTTIEEEIIAWIESGLPEEQGTSNDDADRKKQQRQAERDSNPSKSTSENDPDNGDSRRKERPPLPPTAARLTPLTPVERMEITAQIQNLYFAGRHNEARDLQKIMNQRERYEEKPSVEQQRQSLVDSIVRHGSALLKR